MLSHQKLNDEQASSLVEKFARKNTQLIADGKRKKQKPFPAISEDEKPFKLPKGWLWVRLFDIGTTNIGLTYSPKDISDNGIPVLRSTNVQNGKIDLNDLVRVEKDVKESVVVQEGNLLICARNGSKALVGKTAMIKKPLEKMAFGAFMAIYRSEYNTYIEVFLKSPIFINLLEGVATTTINQITQNNLKSTLIPLPPLEEQKRIVAKVDELMALCDKLEAQQQQQANNVLRANTADINALLNPSSPETSFEQSWQRIAQHFNTLYGCTLPMPKGEGRKKKHLVGLENVKALRRAILDLATTGKLSSSTDKDEAVSILESRITDHQQERIKNKEIKRPKQTNSGSDSNLIVKSGWALKTINEISFVTKLAGFEYSKHINLQDIGEVPVVRAQNVKPFKLKKDKLKYIDLETSRLLFRCALDRPALLVTFIGAGIGDVCIFKEKQRWHLAPNVAKIELFADINIDFICYFLNSSLGRKELFKSMKSTAQPSLSMTIIREIFIPLPPLQEQKRIVAKVDQLMILCDQLEQQFIQSYSDAEKLMEATVKSLIA